MELKLSVHLEIVCFLASHQRGLEPIDERLLSQDPLFKAQNVWIGAFLINLGVLITVHSIDAQLPQHVRVIQRLLLVEI